MAEEGLKGGGGSGRSRRGLAALALCLLAAGCYAYTEASPAAVPPGSNVRLRVDPRATLSAGETPLDTERPIRAKLLEGSTAERLLCSVVLGSGDPLSASRGLRGTVSIPIRDVERLEVRHLERGRTAAAVGAGALLGFVVLDWAFNIILPSESPGEQPGGVDNARIVLFRLGW